MTDQSAPQTATGNEAQSIANGRYLYCLVDMTATSETTFTTTGIDDQPVSVIRKDGIGAVVHECDKVYESEQPEQVKQWVLTHQRVVDTAGEAFGTPLPARFGTVLEGGDEHVEAWLADHRTDIATQLSTFAGQWEYRIQLLWDSSPFEQRVAEDDSELQELKRRRDRSGAGKRFLLKKQAEQRRSELKQQRQTELKHRLTEVIRPHVNELREQNSQVSLGTHSQETDGDCIARVAVLAEEAQESTLGEALDTLVETPGVEIRFTGPWPPYTFAPEFG